MISVIVPVHNGEKTLRRCVDSILRSTEKDMEIILVENGSTDRTLEICRSYSETYDQVRKVVGDSVGLSYARNVGMDAAKGNWIGFVDVDDYIHPSMYAWLKKTAETGHCDFVVGGILTGNQTDYVWTEETCKSGKISKDAYCWNLFCMAQYQYSIVTDKLFSAELLKSLRFDETLRYAEDREFVFRALVKTNTIGFVQNAVYYYYQENQESISKSADIETRMDQVRSLQKCMHTADTSFSAAPRYGDYVAACLLQNADFRKRRAAECGLSSQVEMLEPIIQEAAKRVRASRQLDFKTKARFLLEHDAPGLFHLAVRILKRGASQ